MPLVPTLPNRHFVLVRQGRCTLSPCQIQIWTASNQECFIMEQSAVNTIFHAYIACAVLNSILSFCIPDMWFWLSNGRISARSATKDLSPKRAIVMACLFGGGLAISPMLQAELGMCLGLFALCLLGCPLASSFAGYTNGRSSHEHCHHTKRETGSRHPARSEPVRPFPFTQ